MSDTNTNNKDSLINSPQLINTANIGGHRGDGIPSNSQIDSFLAGIRNTVAGINLPPPSPQEEPLQTYTYSDLTNQPPTF